MNYYVPKRLTPDLKHAKVESGFGLCKNEANLDQSRNSINTCENLAKSWTSPKQNMSKHNLNRNDMYSTHMDVNEPQLPGEYPSTVNISARNLKGG